MVSINKLFYQQAIDELSRGYLDQALFIKVRVENPNNNTEAIQSLYLQARAKELALMHNKKSIKNQD